MRLQELRSWLHAMQAQGADVTRLTVSQYAIHLLLMGGGR